MTSPKNGHNDLTDGANFLRGLAAGVLISLPIWTFIIAGFKGIVGCCR
jgi:hypothetical protein